MRCPACSGNPVSTWPEHELAGMKYVLDSFCPNHRPAADERLKAQSETKTYVLNAKPKQFIPKEVPVKKDWTEKEPVGVGYRADGTVAPDYDVPLGRMREPGEEG